MTRNKDDIRKFELYGTWPESILAIGDAIAFHERAGGAAKEAHHRRLTEFWLNGVKHIPGLKLQTPVGEDLSCGITCVELAGFPAPKLRQWLLDQHKIVTMDITRRSSEFAGIRISPGLPTTRKELSRLVDALQEAAHTAKA